MDLIKIGKFIAEMRKDKNLTQSMLAEKLGISDRAVSKWERGLCLPDAGLMILLCNILGISVNDLLSGEKISMKNNNETYEKNLIELVKKNEQANKMLLRLEIFLGLLGTIIMLGADVISAHLIESNIIKTVVIISATLIFFFIAFFCINIETKAGYYECCLCGNKYIPEYKAVLFATHMGTTRKLKCPQCGKKSWQKKVLK